MKRTILLSFAAMLLFTQCEKEETTPDPQPSPTPVATDTQPPVITLKGKSSDTTYLNGTYTEPGFTATDNVDGNLTTSVVVTGSVNTAVTTIGTFSYNLTDAAGNKAVQQTRTVRVVNAAWFLHGSYSYTAACSTATDTNYGNDISVSTYSNNVIEFSILLTNNTGINPVGYVSGNTITIPKINNDNFYTFEGTGTIQSDKKTILLQTISVSGSNTVTCSKIMRRKQIQ